MRTVINHGLLVDPGSRICSRLHLAMENGKIGAVSPVPLEGDLVIDASGLVVTPGFVDIHMHEGEIDSRSGLVDASIFECMLRMGVTTAVGGNCGQGPADPEGYFALLEAHGCPVNLALLAPHESMRAEAGRKDGYAQAGPEELKRLYILARRLLDGGCPGISLGVRYVPGMNQAELETLARAAAEGKGILSAHVRDDAGGVLAAMEEIAALGRRFAVPVQISHLGSMAAYGQMEEALSYLDAQASAGLDILADCYPYAAFSTGIGRATYDDGFLQRYGMGYEAIEVAEGPWKGRRCTEEMFRHLRQNAPETLTVGHFMRQEEVDLALAHPKVLTASDGLMRRGQGHPRAAGTFPRVLARVREQKSFSLYEAVGKMTWRNARHLRLPKGRLAVGDDADVAVWDSETIMDQATFAAPDTAPAGIRHIFVGGKMALENGEIKGRFGRPVRAV
ncbi:MAG: amidohydrolase family protein [Deltaproteobacteria bacterium]|nr:amidohydrolase family protein [Deltaproteobacteria bacterium]